MGTERLLDRAGGLGVVPTFPISWTHGMNRFVTIAFGLDPDIWGTIMGMVLMTAALVAVPFLDRGGAPLGITSPATRRLAPEPAQLHRGAGTADRARLSFPVRPGQA